MEFNINKGNFKVKFLDVGIRKNLGNMKCVFIMCFCLLNYD